MKRLNRLFYLLLFTLTVSMISASAQSDQDIEWFVPGINYTGDAPFTINSASTSGQPVSFSSSNESVAFVAGNMIFFQNVGITTITAYVPGDENYNEAFATIDIEVTKYSQSITYFDNIGDKVITDGAVQLNAGTDSGNPVYFESSDESVAFVSGGFLYFNTPGLVTITAYVPEDQYYFSAEPATQTFEIIKVISPLISMSCLRLSMETRTLISRIIQRCLIQAIRLHLKAQIRML